METKNCTQCTKEYRVKPCQKDKSLFCSLRCYWDSMKGKDILKEHRVPLLGEQNPFFGRKHTAVAKLLNRLAHMGLQSHTTPHSAESRLKMSASHKATDYRGSRHWNWRGGVAIAHKSERVNAMRKLPYKLWRSAVFKKDDYTCVDCGVYGCELQADHVKPWSQFPELRYETSNGETVCVPCHRKRTSAFLKGNQYARKLQLV